MPKTQTFKCENPMFSIIFWGSGEILYVFSAVFQASTGKKFLGKNHEKNPRTRKFDAKHSAKVLAF